jgi:chromosome partitioning protein
MTEIITVTNQKGGVAKTTTAINLAACLSEAQRRVLLVDMDPQGNATIGSGRIAASPGCTVCEMLMDDVPARDCLVFFEAAHYHVLPANPELTAAEVGLLSKENRQNRLSICLKQIAKDYDYIIIDCPPSLNILTVNAIIASTSLIVPVQCEYYALEGLASLWQTISQISDEKAGSRKVGVVRTLYDARNNLAREVSEELRAGAERYSYHVYDTIIPRNVRIAEAPGHGVPINLYDRQSRGTEAYMELAGEMLRYYEPL